MREVIEIAAEKFSEVVPTVPGTYAVRRKERSKGFSQAQIVRLMDGGYVIGPGWPNVHHILDLQFLWGPQIKIQTDVDSWY